MPNEKPKYGRYDTVEIDGNKVRALRKRLGMTQVALSATVPGVSRGYVSTIESRGRVRVSRVAAEHLAAALGKQCSDLEVIPRAEGMGAKPFRFGSGFGSKPKSRADLLREVLEETRSISGRIEEIRELIDLLLAAEEDSDA